MDEGTLQTRRLTLLPATVEHVRALIEGEHAFTLAFSREVAPDYTPPEFRSALVVTLDGLLAGEADPRWWTYLFLCRGDGERLIGLGGFKGAPCPRGSVEAGYSIAPSFRNRGYASEAPAGLVRFAFSRDGVRTVIAHTLAETSASTRVLARNGFERLGPVTGPEDANLATWRWRLQRPAARP